MSQENRKRRTVWEINFFTAPRRQGSELIICIQGVRTHIVEQLIKDIFTALSWLFLRITIQPDLPVRFIKKGQIVDEKVSEFQCTYCDFTSTSKQGLRTHQARKHTQVEKDETAISNSVPSDSVYYILY